MNTSEFRALFPASGRKQHEYEAREAVLKAAPVKAKPVKADPYKSQLERDFAARLESFKQGGIIKDWKYEPIKLLIGNTSRGGRWYKPDFMITDRDGIRFCECKGYEGGNRIAGVRYFEQAAERYPQFKWFMVKRGTNGQFDYEEVISA